MKWKERKTFATKKLGGGAMVVWLKQWQQELRRKNRVERDSRVNGTIYLDVGGKGEEGYKMILSFESN